MTNDLSRLNTLTTLRDTLLPRLLSGEIELPAAGAVAEGVQ